MSNIVAVDSNVELPVLPPNLQYTGLQVNSIPLTAHIHLSNGRFLPSHESAYQMTRAAIVELIAEVAADARENSFKTATVEVTAYLITQRVRSLFRNYEIVHSDETGNFLDLSVIYGSGNVPLFREIAHNIMQNEMLPPLEKSAAYTVDRAEKHYSTTNRQAMTYTIDVDLTARNPRVAVNNNAVQLTDSEPGPGFRNDEFSLSVTTSEEPVNRNPLRLPSVITMLKSRLLPSGSADDPDAVE